MFKGVIAIDGQEHHITGVGNGAISSLANALKSLGIDLDITDYKEHAIGEGKEVKAATYIECTTASGDKQQKVWGVGIHEDVVQASLMALLSAASSVTRATEALKENGVVAHLESQINGV
jgi:2-isopropylmalate synthase